MLVDGPSSDIDRRATRDSGVSLERLQGWRAPESGFHAILFAENNPEQGDNAHDGERQQTADHQITPKQL